VWMQLAGGSATAEPIGVASTTIGGAIPWRASVAVAPDADLVDLEDEDVLAMRAMQAGDPAGLEALYDHHHRAAMALAYRIVGDRVAAEDVVQEAFLSAWRRASSYDPSKGAPRRWLLSIVHHRAIDRIRRAAVGGPTSELDENLADHRSADVFQSAWLGMQREELRAALAQIPSEQREAIELAYFGGLTQLEIAARQQIPLGTAKGRVRIGLQKLKTLLQPTMLVD
jgi:RNA polymerase sigma-70 factor, ECF subfamily